MHTTKMTVADLRWSNFWRFSICHHEWAGMASTAVRLLVQWPFDNVGVCVCVVDDENGCVGVLLELVMHVECDQFV